MREHHRIDQSDAPRQPTGRFPDFCRYAARPPLSMDRLEALPDGRLRYWFKTAWRNGTTHAIFEPLEFMEKLAALVPTPRAHLVRFHGLLGPAAKWRPLIVPQQATTEAPLDSSHMSTSTPACSGADPADCSQKPKPADAAEHGTTLGLNLFNASSRQTS